MKTLTQPSAYIIGNDTWIEVSKGFVEERTWQSDSYDPIEGVIIFGKWVTNKVWKEVTSKPFVF